MITKIIDGKTCQRRDVIYSDFGAVTETEKKIASMKSSEEFKSQESRAKVFKDRSFSWVGKNPYDYNTFSEEEIDRAYSHLSDSELEALYQENENDNSSVKDTEYSAGVLNTRLITLRRPLHIQLKNLHREHTRFYRSKASSLKSEDVDLLIEEFRYELHRIIAKAKDVVIDDGGNMNTVLKVTSIGGGSDLQQTLRRLTILFKRVEQAYKKFGFIPRTYLTRMNDSLNILVSHFILDVYGPELEKRKLESSKESNKDTK